MILLILNFLLLNNVTEALKNLAVSEGILAGISSGAALAAAIALAKDSRFEGKNIVVILPDTGERYLSSLASQNA